MLLVEAPAMPRDAEEKVAAVMSRIRSSYVSSRRGHRAAARRASRVQRTAIIAVALGSLLGVTTGVVQAQVSGARRAQVSGARRAQAVGGAQAIGVASVRDGASARSDAEKKQKKQENQPLGVDCKITMPASALTAHGLATPWVLSAKNGAPCKETVAGQAAFIDATIFDPATNKVSIYRPLVITQGTKPAVQPVAPPLPAGAVVEISVGFNGDTITLADRHGGRDIAAANCVNGLRGSIFGQEIYCNAAAFYAAANGKVSFPPLATSPDDGRPCPTTESWEIVDQDQSDNTTTNYLVQGNQTAQNTIANQGRLGSNLVGNGSDNNLYTRFYAPAIHCQPPQATDVSDPGAPVQSTSSALLNLYARAANNPSPALVPLGDPFTQVNGKPSLEKTNLYRAQVNQPPAAGLADASTAAYCTNLLDQGLAKIELDKPFLQALGRSPDPAVSNDLHLFILNRFKDSWDNLQCQQEAGIPNPVTVKTDANGSVVSAEVKLRNGDPGATSTTAPPSTTAPSTTAAPTTTAAPSTTAAPTTMGPGQ
jgi:hypothetical protein